MKKYILLFTIIFSTQAHAQPWGGWSHLTKSGSSVFPYPGVTINTGLIEFSVDSAAALADSMVMVKQNVSGATWVIDSIHVAERADDKIYIFRKSNYSGATLSVIDTVTASTNGTGTFYKTETTLTSNTVANGQRIWMKRPASSGPSVYVRIHYRKQ